MDRQGPRSSAPVSAKDQYIISRPQGWAPKRIMDAEVQGGHRGT